MGNEVQVHSRPNQPAIYHYNKHGFCFEGNRENRRLLSKKWHCPNSTRAGCLDGLQRAARREARPGRTLRMTVP